METEVGNGRITKGTQLTTNPKIECRKKFTRKEVK